MITLPAGRLNRRIRIEAPPTAQDADYGTVSGAWATVATVWAWIEDVLPSKAQAEANTGNVRIAAMPTRVRIHYRADITSDMRIVLLDRSNALLKIVAGPVELGNRSGIEFTAEKFSMQGAAA